MGWIKARIYAIGAALLLALVAIARFFKFQRDNARRDRDRYKAQVDEQLNFNAIEAEIDSEYSDLARESRKDVKEGEMPGHIRDRANY